ncbi:hypothetical protein FH972_000179 [Carpinus fangiana]|uniref:PGG domain-containing protein n=1 Tax=Carpinus fangiana TaxID=176857 RepID=A0A5N6Q811_9ROSI|nr:hypothetical protein FH972_000179 [Carpinus fangiana]
MTSHCLILLSMVFPLQSISAHDASSFNGGLSLIQVDNCNVEDLVPQIQRSNSEVTVDVRSRKGRHSLWHRHRHLRNGHEILIIIGWGIMLPVGVIVARNERNIAGGGRHATIVLGLKTPYQEALNGDWEAIKSFYDKHLVPERVVHPLTIDGLTAFHIAGYNSEGTELLQHLLGLLAPSDISLAISKKSDHDNNVFHEVASINNVASAKLLITKLSGNNLPELKKILEDRNQLGETPLFRAAALGQTKMAKFLAKLVGDISPHLHRYDSMSILHAAVLKVEDRPISLRKGDSVNDDGEGGTSKGEGGDQTLDTPLLIAASEGIAEIFDEILDVHSQAIEYISKDGVTILVAAFCQRQREIFHRLKMMKGVMEHRLFSLIDKRGYTILHHAADMKNYNGGSRAGPALQLQDELQWLENTLILYNVSMQRVRKIVPSHYVLHRNNAGKTADELFKEQHANLLEKAERWIKETSQYCSTIAVLVATVVFTAAYTIPGGNDQSGHPVFLHSPFFLFFTIMDVISLASSLTYELLDLRRHVPLHPHVSI